MPWYHHLLSLKVAKNDDITAYRDTHQGLILVLTQLRQLIIENPKKSVDSGAVRSISEASSHVFSVMR